MSIQRADNGPVSRTQWAWPPNGATAKEEKVTIEPLSDKQIAWRKYYRENRAQLLQKKKDKAALNPNYRPREERMIKRVCFNCGGKVVQDEFSGIWQCLNPECESEFQEVDS